MTLEVFGQLFHYGGKFVATAGAGHKVFEHLKKEHLTSLEKLDVLAQGVFITMTGVSVVLTEIPQSRLSSTASNIGLQAGEAGADVARVVTSKMAKGGSWTKDDYLNLLGIMSVRAEGVTGFICHNYPMLLSGHKNQIEFVGNVVGSIGTGIRNRKVIISGGKAFLVAGKNLFKWPLKKESESKSDAESPTQVSGKLKNPLSEEDQKEAVAALREVNAFKEAFLKDPKSCSEIPDFLIENEFWTYICAITNKPIRFIKVPELSKEIMAKHPELYNCWYEANALESWLKENSDKAPPGWPEGAQVPKITEFVAEPRMQSGIDGQLERIMKRL